jgi:hypothetical protein
MDEVAVYTAVRRYGGKTFRRDAMMAEWRKDEPRCQIFLHIAPFSDQWHLTADFQQAGRR